MVLLQVILVNIVAAAVVVTIKEFTKALISSQLGDPLPKRDMRITLNPFKHIEPIGLFLIVFRGFGWGKPVQTGSLYYKNRKRDILITHLVPSAVILVLGMAVSFVIFTFSIPMHILLLSFLQRVSFFGVSLALFNMVPINPMDGAKVLSVFLHPNQVIRMAGMDKTMLIVLVVVWLVWPDNPLAALISFLTQVLLGLTL